MAFMMFTTSLPAPSGLALRLPAVALLVCLAVGCENPNQAFSGRWGPSESIDPADSSIDLGAGPVWPQLHLGHYGLEVAGVATFHPSELVTGPTATCACSLVEHRHLNLDTQALVFTTDCGGEMVDWALAITRDEDDQVFLQGTVERTDGTGPPQTLRLERSLESVDPFDPFCEEPGS